MTDIRTFGLIGFPLEHSFSARYFSEKFKRENITDAQYINFPLPTIEFFPEIFKKGYYILGLNVTIPYKQSIIPYLHSCSEAVKEIGAVNTIKIQWENTNSPFMKGYNTDEYGFRTSLLECIKPYHKKALILGTGGASKAIEYVLKELGITFLNVSRSPVEENQIGYRALNEDILSEYTLIINTTPVGMYPHINDFPPIPYQYITSKHLLYDLIYNPEITEFMRKGQQQGATVVNGLKMLYLQAEKAWEIWNNPNW